MDRHDHEHEHEHAVVATAPGEGGLPCVRQSAADGSSIVIYLHGATLTSYRTAGGQEVLFVSSMAIYDGVKPIRGGVPIAFPQFAAQGPLPMHGFARTSEWTPVRSEAGVVELELKDSEATRVLWPHPFRLRYRITFDSAHIELRLVVLNPADAPAPFAFEALLHGYFALSYGDDSGGAERARILGLEGVTYIDKPLGGVRAVQPPGPLRLDTEVDRIYCNTPAEVRVEGIVPPPELSGKAYRALTVKRAGAVRDVSPRGRLTNVVLHAPLDVVVWNPGPVRGAAIADLGPGNWKHYVCIEPGRVSPDTAAFPAHAALAPGHEWTLTQTVALELDA